MERTAVISSTLRSVGYDSENRILELEFTSETVYQYYGVPEQIYLELLKSASLGGYFNQCIKLGGYEYERID